MTGSLAGLLVDPGSPVAAAQSVGWALPMGPVGITLPAVLLVLSLTSLRLGFGAAGGPASQAPSTQQDWVGGCTCKWCGQV